MYGESQTFSFRSFGRQSNVCLNFIWSRRLTAIFFTLPFLWQHLKKDKKKTGFFIFRCFCVCVWFDRWDTLDSETGRWRNVRCDLPPVAEKVTPKSWVTLHYICFQVLLFHTFYVISNIFSARQIERESKSEKREKVLTIKGWHGPSTSMMVERCQVSPTLRSYNGSTASIQLYRYVCVCV